ncbi:proton channel OtopLc-like [Lineus longissimus]|uniref:proton channel OtopLc-like n=1 Tax=Lineus longissimus TaxID=88925 RepID=UPI00315C4C04
MSQLYALLLCVISAGLPVAAIMTDHVTSVVPSIYFTFLFVVGTAYLLYVLLYLLRGSSSKSTWMTPLPMVSRPSRPMRENHLSSSPVGTLRRPGNTYRMRSRNDSIPGHEVCEESVNSSTREKPKTHTTGTSGVTGSMGSDCSYSRRCSATSALQEVDEDIEFINPLSGLESEVQRLRRDESDAAWTACERIFETMDPDRRPRKPSISSSLTYCTAFKDELAANTSDFRPEKVFRENDVRIQRSRRVTVLSSEEAHSPGFYQRIGAILFGTGTVISCALQSAAAVEAIMICPDLENDHHRFELLAHTSQAVFTMLQLFFFFKHSKISINHHKALSRFGLMHLVATNVGVWLQTLVRESVHSSHHQESHDNEVHDDVIGGNVTTAHDRVRREAQGNVDIGHFPNSSCAGPPTLGAIMSVATPFLYPFVIEYSLIAAVATYVIYTNIGLAKKSSQEETMTPLDLMGREINLKTGFSVDCHRSSKGLFLGIAIVATVVTTTVMFMVFHEQHEMRHVGNMMYYYTDSGLLFIAFLGVIYTAFQVKKLTFVQNASNGPDEILLSVALVGVYTFDVLSLVWAFYTHDLHNIFAALVRPLLSSVQATVQVIFIQDGIRRQSTDIDLLLRKPGQEGVIFLLMTNVALWILYTFQTRTVYSDPDGYRYLLSQVWLIVTYICTPLVIFFRFHSTACLADIWKSAYNRKKKHH